MINSASIFHPVEPEANGATEVSGTVTPRRTPSPVPRPEGQDTPGRTLPSLLMDEAGSFDFCAAEANGSACFPQDSAEIFSIRGHDGLYSPRPDAALPHGSATTNILASRDLAIHCAGRTSPACQEGKSQTHKVLTLHGFGPVEALFSEVHEACGGEKVIRRSAFRKLSAIKQENRYI